MALKKVQTGDGEQVLFAEVDEPSLDFRTFNSMFANVYEIGDFNRHKAVSSQIPQPVEPEAQVRLGEFLQWALALMPQHSWSALSDLVEEFDDIFFIDESLSYSKWLEFFEHYFARTELKIQSGRKDGVRVLPLNAVQNPHFEKIIVVGLSENNLVEKQDTALHWTDIESIKINFGFNLPHADHQVVLDRLNWMTKKNLSEMLFTHSETDFAGQFQAPSMYWLQGALAQDHNLELDSPSETRWDQIMKIECQSHLSASLDLQKQRLHHLKRDLGQVQQAPVPYAKLRLSPSSIEEYFKCPFRLFARKALKLDSLPSLDLDIDYMTRGRLMHRVCELVVRDKKFSMDDGQILELIDQARLDIEMVVYSDKIWKFLRPYYLKLTKAFIHFEVQWRRDFPATRTYAVETFLEAKVGLDEKGLLQFHVEEGVPLRGVIDRLDVDDQDRFVVLDYKSSDSGLTQYTSWLKKGKVQLALYSLALMEGVLDGKKRDVIGAFYYVLKNIDRKKGFLIAEAGPDFLPATKKKMTRDERDQLFDETRELVAKILGELLEGRVETAPHEERNCETCDWNTVCRHPALNL